MNISKRNLFIIAAILLVGAAVLASTGGGKKADIKTEGKIEITFWHVYSENFGATVINEMINSFNASQERIFVKGVYNPDMYPGLMRNLQAEVSAGHYPSVVMIGYNYLDYFANTFEYVSPTTLDIKDYLTSTFLPNILSLAQVEGKQIGIPMSISAPILYYNADLFVQAGLDPNKPPATWYDVMKYAERIKNNSGADYGFYMQEYADNWAVQGLLESNGTRMLSNGKASFATDEAVEAYMVLRNMVAKGTAYHVDADTGIAAFTSGRIGMLLGTSAKIGTTSQASSFDLRAGTFPKFEGKDIRIPAGGNFLAITEKDAAKQAAAFEFIQYVMQPEWLAKWSVGTGYLPPREDVSAAIQSELEEGVVRSLWEVAFNELQYIYSWASYPGDVGARAEQLFADTRDDILGGKDIRTALVEAQAQINKWIDEIE